MSIFVMVISACTDALRLPGHVCCNRARRAHFGTICHDRPYCPSAIRTATARPPSVSLSQ